MTARDASGQILGQRYVLAAPIGRGGMGTVYRARDLQGGPDVAIKVLSAAGARRRRGGDRFERELQALRQVRHPHTVEVYADGTTAGGERWFAMELCPGRPLSRHIEAPLPAEEIAVITRQILSALAAIHQAGLVHRDLKPGNVMVERTPSGPVARVLDFGIVRFLDPDPQMSVLTRRGTVLGTPEYMAPETFTTGTSGPASDLYAVGLLVHTMATGRPPFLGPDAHSILRAHVEQPTPDPDRPRQTPLPPHLRRLHDALLQKDPRRRPASAERALDLLDGRGLPPLPRGAWVGLAVLAAAILGIAGGIAALSLLDRWWMTGP
jgi:eukaryotic-like serine/threonine-protein kinase